MHHLCLERARFISAGHTASQQQQTRDLLNHLHLLLDHSLVDSHLYLSFACPPSDDLALRCSTIGTFFARGSACQL
jgi:hypothetical protein